MVVILVVFKSERLILSVRSAFYMIILLEGFDGSGKSTLTKMLKEKLPEFGVWHPGAPPKDSKDAIERCYEQQGLFKVASQINLIMDRTTCISDEAYTLGKLDRNYKMFREFIAGADHVVVVYCHTSDLENQEFLVSEHDNATSIKHAKDNAADILRYYDNLMEDLSSLGAEVYQYDYKKPSSFAHLVNFLTSNQYYMV